MCEFGPTDQIATKISEYASELYTYGEANGEQQSRKVIKVITVRDFLL